MEFYFLKHISEKAFNILELANISKNRKASL
jgi:hypothetical protein